MSRNRYQRGQGGGGGVGGEGRGRGRGREGAGGAIVKSGVVAQRTNRGKRFRPVILSNELRKPNGVPCIDNSDPKTVYLAVADAHNHRHET